MNIICALKNRSLQLDNEMLFLVSAMANCVTVIYNDVHLRITTENIYMVHRMGR